MEWDKKRTQKEPRITSLSAWTRLHIAYQEEYGNRFVPTSKVRCLPAFIDYIFQQPRIYIGNNSPYLSHFVEKHSYIAMIPTNETGPSRPESIQTAYTGPAEVSVKKQLKSSSCQEMIRFLTNYIIEQGAMTQSQLIAQMLKEKNPNNIDIWECIYASSSFNTMVQKAFKLVKLSAGQWSFKEVIEFAEKQEFKDCRSLADTGELLLMWLGYHNIMYYMWRDAVINVLTKAKNKINTLCLEGVSNAGKSFWTRPLKRIFRFYGEMDTQAGYRFIYQDCVNKPIIFFEEPNLIPEAAQKFKLIAEGENTYVSIKNKEDELLERTPVILTTKNPLWKWCNAEEHAFKNRMYYFIFNRACPALMDFGEPHPLIYKLLLDNKNL